MCIYKKEKEVNKIVIIDGKCRWLIKKQGKGGVSANDRNASTVWSCSEDMQFNGIENNKQ